MTTDRRIADQAYRVVVEARVAELLRYRRWYRAHRWANWPMLRQEVDVELRALVRLARQARRLAAVEDAREAATLAHGDHFAYATGGNGR